MSPLRVGICVNKRKCEKLKFRENTKKFADHGIELVIIDMDCDLEQQGPFDIIIHKVLDYSEESAASGVEKTEILRQYAKTHKNDVVMVDSIELTEKVADRVEMTKILQSCEMTVDNIKVFVPKSTLIQEGTSMEEVQHILKKESFQFPILSKPVSSACNLNAHDITLIFSDEFLADLPIPCIIQEFCNHGGILYKVFMMGDSYRTCERPSIKNFSCHTQPSIFFDTRNISKTNKPYQPELHGFDPLTAKWRSSDDDPNMLNNNVVQKIVKEITKTWGVSLSGLDIIIEEGTGNYGIIDLNYFPGYDGVGQHFVEDLSNFLLRIKSHEP